MKTETKQKVGKMKSGKVVGIEREREEGGERQRNRIYNQSSFITRQKRGLIMLYIEKKES